MRIPNLLAFFAIALNVNAQCPFTPTIEPTAPILCPGEVALLSTQEYDAYQWYVDGAAVNGATGQTFSIQPLAEVTVAATLDGCTELSAPVIVDGWVFLLPFVIHAGDEPRFIDGNGVAHHCEGDTALFIFSYPNNIQWFDNGTPIAGATDDTLVVTSTGNYTAVGAPDNCPNFIQPLGLEIPVTFAPTVQPTILLIDGQLCASPFGDDHQWFLNGQPLPGNEACIVDQGAGAYTVDVTYQTGCSRPSEPYFITGVNDVTSLRPSLFPVPARDVLTVQWHPTAGPVHWQLVDQVGREVRAGGSDQAAATIDVAALPNGTYWLRGTGHASTAVQVVR
jgi:hypothetical protein